MLKKPGRQVLGIDVDPGASDNPTIDEFRLIEDVDHWPVESNSIDFVYSDYVLEHVKDPQSFFSELNRVLKPGGGACFRTPNRWGYVAMIAAMVPNKLHTKVLKKSQPSRNEIDVFPTYYRCNTPGVLKKHLGRNQFECCVLRHQPAPNYFGFSQIAYRIAAIAHNFLPPFLKSTLLVFARKET